MRFYKFNKRKISEGNTYVMQMALPWFGLNI